MDFENALLCLVFADMVKYLDATLLKQFNYQFLLLLMAEKSSKIQSEKPTLVST